MTITQLLLDEREIRAVLVTYAYAVDGKRYDDLDNVFALEVERNYGMCSGTGIASLKALVRGYLDRCGPTQHLLGSMRIEVEGLTATASTYVQARHQGRGLRRLFSFDANGVYRDQLERFPEGWRIVRRHAEWRAHRGRLVVFLSTARRGRG